MKNVDFRKTMDIDAATGECTVVKVGRKYITVEDSHGWEIRFDMENNFEEVDDSFSYSIILLMKGCENNDKNR